MTDSPLNLLQNQPISSFCKYFDNNEKDEETCNVDKFVGLRYQNKKFEIHFPVGYKEQTVSRTGDLQTDEASSINEKSRDILLRKDILNLISILSAYGEKSLMLTSSNVASQTAEVAFPIHAYMFS